MAEKATPTTGVDTPEHSVDNHSSVALPPGWPYKVTKIGRWRLWYASPQVQITV